MRQPKLGVDISTYTPIARMAEDTFLLWVHKDSGIKNIKDFVAAAKKSKREINPVSGEDVQKLIVKILATPAKTVAAARKNIKSEGKLQKAVLNYFQVTGKVTKTKRGGRRVYFTLKGKKVKTSVSGSKTKVTIDGKKAKRKAIKKGMTCTFNWLGDRSGSKNIDCKS